MLEAERIAENPCGCRNDKVTGLWTFICEAHQQERDATLGQARLARETKEEDHG